MSGIAGIELVGRSTAEQVAEGLSNLIVNGSMHPGERLSEAGIARTLGLSRNTVREALRLLQGSGLVRYSFNRGLVVWDPTDEDILEVFKARLYLERLAASCLDETTDLTDLERTHAEFEDALNSADPRIIVEKDLALHRAVVATLGSERLNRFFAGLMLELRYFLMLLSVELREYEDPTSIRAEHRQLIEAFSTRRPDAAAAATTALVLESQQLLRDLIAQRTTSNSRDG